jgi:hypothetical protein
MLNQNRRVRMKCAGKNYFVLHAYIEMKKKQDLQNLNYTLGAVNFMNLD